MCEVRVHRYMVMCFMSWGVGEYREGRSGEVGR